MTPLAKKSARPPEKSYAHRPLLDKLGVKPESLVALINVSDKTFLTLIKKRAKNIAHQAPLRDSDLIFFGAESEADLGQLRILRGFLKPNGGIWVIYPKGRQHIRESTVIAAAKSSGLVDNKVVGFSATHTALRLVIPLAQR
ncbi:MAG: hypothetical protein ACRD4K_13520 [Candidatus Acidiferrales bacterium]